MGSLWQTYHNNQGDPAVTSMYAYVDAQHSSALADLGNTNFTIDMYVNLANAVLPSTPVSKGHTVYHAYQDYYGNWGYASVGWAAGFVSHWIHTEDDYVSVGFQVSGKYYINGNWEHASMSIDTNAKPTGWWLNNWRHIAFTAQRLDYSHWWDIIIYVEGYRESYSTVGNNYGLIRQGINNFSDMDDHIFMNENSLKDMPGYLPYTHQPIRLGWTRISNFARYPTDGTAGDFKFTPPPRTPPPSVDGNTLGLWYFNEAGGAISLNQQGDHAVDAIIYDGIWDTNILTLNI